MTLNELRELIARRSPYHYTIVVRATDYEGENVAVRVDIGPNTFYSSGRTLERALETLARKI